MTRPVTSIDIARRAGVSRATVSAVLNNRHALRISAKTKMRVLAAAQGYYNRVRTHLSLCKDAPLFRRRQTVGNIVSIPILGGLHHQYVRG